MLLYVQAGELGETCSTSTTKISVLSRNRGWLENNTYFAGSEAWYEVSVENDCGTSGGDVCGPTTNNIIYTVGEGEYSAEVVDGVAKLLIPTEQSGKLKLLYNDVTEVQNIAELEYIISEMDSPIVNGEIIDIEGEKQICVTIEEMGNCVSGIKTYACSVDGKLTEDIFVNETRMRELHNGFYVRDKIEIIIPIKDMEEHEVIITAEDNRGNAEEKIVAIDGAPDISIGKVSALLPTNFSILMFKEMNNETLVHRILIN